MIKEPRGASRAHATWPGAMARLDRGVNCPVCATPSDAVGTKRGAFSQLPFEVRRCAACAFSYVRDPIADPEIYNEAYYRGHGADPLIDYVYELEHPGRTVRDYEWKGTVEIIERLIGDRRQGTMRWLDYGCGTGGLVRYARQAGFDAWGFEEGHGAEFARRAQVPLLDGAALASAPPFDVVTAIEVMEHVFDVKEVLASIRRLVAPGGVFFYTTGNPKGRTGNELLSWSYLIPEIHVSLFEPRTMERALGAAGFLARYVAPTRGHAKIVRSRALKNLGIKSRWPLGLPWGLQALSPVLRTITGVLAHPVGIASAP